MSVGITVKIASNVYASPPPSYNPIPTNTPPPPMWRGSVGRAGGRGGRVGEIFSKNTSKYIPKYIISMHSQQSPPQL